MEGSIREITVKVGVVVPVDANGRFWCRVEGGSKCSCFFTWPGLSECTLLGRDVTRQEGGYLAPDYCPLL